MKHKKISYIDIQIKANKSSWTFNPSTKVIRDKKKEKIRKEVYKDRLNEC
jgi:hypothetical protein